MIYLVLSAVTLALLYGVYRLVLSRTTLHRFNRNVLLSILVLSFILPAVRIDSLSISLPQLTEKKSVAPDNITSFLPITGNDEVVEAMGVADMTEAPDQIETGAISSAVQTIETAAKIMNISLLDVLTYIYIVGLALMLLRLLIGIIRVETLCRLGGRRLGDGSKLVILEGEFQPSSWRNTILISRDDYETDSAAIIEHEQAHIRCHHSVDVLLSQIVCALQWFNPAAWMLKRSLTEVHEYEADATVLSCGYNERQYQVSLVQAALRRQVGLVTSNFADCSTKKRIKMMKRNQSSPFACLKALLLLPAVAVLILMSSACKSDTVQDTSSDASAPAVEEPVVTPEPYDTLAFLEKFSHGQGQDDFIIVSQLNHFITIEADGSIWFNIAGQNNYQRAYLPSLDNDFEHAKSLSTVEVKNPEKVFVMYNRDNHLDICAEVIRQLQKSYTDENIIFALEPWKRTVPPPPGLKIDTEKDDYLIVMINSNNEIRMEGQWSPGEGIKANFSSQEPISPQEISKLDGLIRAGIPEINEKNPGESTIVKGLKGCLQWDLTCSHRVVNEVEKILRRYVEPGYVLYQRPTLVVNSK